jgi:hypothetical protein
VASAAPDEGSVRVAATAATFESLDKNADRRISRTEAGRDRVVSETFAYIDTNADGFVDKAEFAARQ